jgi:hypothetical protein
MKRLPTNGMSPSAKRRMNVSSSPAGTTCTPPGFAMPAAIFAMTRDVPPPIDTDSCVSSSTAFRMRRAVTSSDSSL